MVADTKNPPSAQAKPQPPARSIRRDRRATVGIAAGVALIPLIAAAGAGIDMARLSMAKSTLQAAVDEAALAGGAAYTSATASTAATTAATTYFNRYVGTVSGLVTVSSVVATPGTGNNAQGLPSYTVAVTATATLQPSLLKIVNVGSLSVTASATAANPQVQPVVTVGFSGANAADWNAIFLYPIPGGATPDYNAIPAKSQTYEISSNCNSSASSYSVSSQCLALPGATVPTSQSFSSVSATQPLGFMLVNQRRGLDPLGSANAAANSYGAAVGNIEIMSTGPMSQGHGPAYNTDNSATLWNTFSGQTVTQAATHYSTANTSATPNCALQIQVVDPNNLPTAPPASGRCFSATDQDSGVQYANLSCSQMAGRTFMYWWNDMSGATDDKDYNDMYYTFRCVPGVTTPGSAIIYTDLSVSLIR